MSRSKSTAPPAASAARAAGGPAIKKPMTPLAKIAATAHKRLTMLLFQQRTMTGNPPESPEVALYIIPALARGAVKGQGFPSELTTLDLLAGSSKNPLVGGRKSVAPAPAAAAPPAATPAAAPAIRRPA